ncbi:ABC transporter substrate-binding protein [Catelliglobosispora koreensis]|uniref:ABC transporter substrate-binding protein n=1 Tax=Catelliglobosispora koreensis TaxID=129052 RepID=UPI00036D47B0|nr:ABC transporter substrate-binding protein [Catelliglobosispora koreensis]
MKLRPLAIALAAALLAAGCGGGDADPGSTDALPPADPASVTGEVTVLTNRTDLVTDGTMKKYADEFKKTYPGVTVKFEGITDYEGEVKIRMNTENYGDVLLIPNTIVRDDYPKFFANLGSVSSVGGKYLFTDKSTVSGKVYGLAGFGAVNGFVYNKEVWAQAGLTQWPTTPEGFLAALQAIKDKTQAIPYYTNYKDGWPLTSWSSVVGSVTCDTKAQDKLASATDPWAAGSDLRAGDGLLFNIVKNKLSEPDPATTNWEDSKGLIATGKVGSMWLGSWAIAQMQDAAKKAGKDPATIGYMPFPAQVNGKYCSVLSPDYQYAVNVHSKSKPAARAWIDWMLDKSGFAEANQAVSTVKGAPLPSALKPFTDNGVQFIELSQEKAGLFNKIDNASEVGLNKQDYRQRLVDVARGAAPGDLNSVLGELARKWSEAAKLAGS